MLSCGALEAPPVKAPPPSPVLEATRPDDMESLVTCAVEKVRLSGLFLESKIYNYLKDLEANLIRHRCPYSDTSKQRTVEAMPCTSGPN